MTTEVMRITTVPHPRTVPETAAATTTAIAVRRRRTHTRPTTITPTMPTTSAAHRGELARSMIHTMIATGPATTTMTIGANRVRRARARRAAAIAMGPSGAATAALPTTRKRTTWVPH